MGMKNVTSYYLNCTVQMIYLLLHTVVTVHIGKKTINYYFPYLATNLIEYHVYYEIDLQKC